jgi:oligopeptide/dipeptide ABC transporter ATP-binding protein
MSPLLEIRGLRKEFPVRSAVLRRAVGTVVAVDHVDLDLRAGETVALVGESGSGKTTLGRSILRLIEPTTGSIRFREEELVGLSADSMRRRRRSLQMVFQDPYLSLNPRMRIGDIVLEPLLVHGLATRRERTQRVVPLLEEVGLGSEALERFPHEFSGGQRQRIGIARALASSPELIVADEPVSALDMSVRAQVVNLLVDLQARRGLAMLFIAHDLALVESIADRVAVLYLGRIVEEGPTREVVDRPRHPYTAALLSAVPSPEVGAADRRIVLGCGPPGVGAPPGGCPFHPRCPIAEARCRIERPELRESGAGGKVSCHRPGELRLDDLGSGVEPFARANVMNDNAESGANQRGYEA